ncbi:MAG: sugar phosphate isomerase/epimerase [Planctomycetota bacterium]
MFRLGYNTNGLAHHRLEDALDLLADLGYEAVAITPDVGGLDPLALDVERVASIRRRLEDHGLAVAVETGARFLLDPRRKHRPTLLEHAAHERERRVDFLRRSIDLAVGLGAEVVSIWSGAAPEDVPGTLDAEPDHPLGERLADGVLRVLDHARAAGIRLGFEPEPGMFVERPSGFEALVERLGPEGDDLGLTLDVGHCVVTGDEPVSAITARFQDRLVHVHLDDCPRGQHLHVPFGQGDLDLADALGGLLAAGFHGMAAVELSRDAHRGPAAAAEALASVREVFSERL